jgi:hypothetical protein
MSASSWTWPSRAISKSAPIPADSLIPIVSEHLPEQISQQLFSSPNALPTPNYFGQTDARGFAHGWGARLTADGKVINRQCGRWEEGLLVQNGHVWTGFLNLPLTFGKVTQGEGMQCIAKKICTAA